MRDGKPRTAKPQHKSQGGTLLGIFIGLVIGVLIAFGLVWYLNKTPLPFQERAPRVDKAVEGATPGQPVVAPQALPGKPGDKAAEKPRFEFYKILPGGQEAPENGAAAPAPEKAAAPAAPAAQLHLQVGAFQKAADADNLKAKLALMGVEASVQQVNVADKGTLHRVRVGPFVNPEEMNRVRTQLAQGGIQATLVKSGESADTKSETKSDSNKSEAKAESKPAKQ